MNKALLKDAVSATTYPGRGIIAGRTADGEKAFFAYFIMVRSVNSRNRVFVRDGEGIRTRAYDPAKLKDPSLVIYAPVRKIGNHTIVTNGDQTDTIYDFVAEGKSFADACRTRCFEPDAPNFTPRISMMATFADGGFSFDMSEDADCIEKAVSKVLEDGYRTGDILSSSPNQCRLVGCTEMGRLIIEGLKKG